MADLRKGIRADTRGAIERERERKFLGRYGIISKNSGSYRSMMRSELNESLPRLLELITKETLRKYGTDQSEDTLVVRKSDVTEKMLVEFIAQFLEKE